MGGDGVGNGLGGRLGKGRFVRGWDGGGSGEEMGMGSGEVMGWGKGTVGREVGKGKRMGKGWEWVEGKDWEWIRGRLRTGKGREEMGK